MEPDEIRRVEELIRQEYRLANRGLELMITGNNEQNSVAKTKSLVELIRQNYRKPKEKPKGLSERISDYIHSIPNRLIPIRINDDIRRTAIQQTRGIDEKLVRRKGFALFEWFEDNFGYHVIEGNRYKNSIEAFHDRYGNCAEAAFLYIAMARSIGIESYFINVKVDCNRDKVQHACASVVDDKRIILADPAYHQYDIKHQDIEIYSDLKMIFSWLRVNELSNII